jgi:hypothetical protein
MFLFDEETKPPVSAGSNEVQFKGSGRNRGLSINSIITLPNLLSDG